MSTNFTSNPWDAALSFIAILAPEAEQEFVPVGHVTPANRAIKYAQNKTTIFMRRLRFRGRGIYPEKTPDTSTGNILISHKAG